jgi:hypothetical protein
MAGTARTTSTRALGRATLARQHLLARTPRPPLELVRDLVGFQAQNPLDPYLALWSRVDDLDPVALGALVEQRRLVRIVVMRGTIHLVTADDAGPLRALSQPVLDAEILRHSEFAPQLIGVDATPVLEAARAALAATPMSTTRLREFIAERFPDLPAAALAYACRCHLPLVQVPPRGVWGRTSAVTLAELDGWVRDVVDSAPALTMTIDDLVLRYLGAFGPATVADAAAWSRLTGLREVFERLRPRLEVLHDERGRELFDLPDAPRPDPEVGAPVRFLPEYDNVLLSHADRSRFHADLPLDRATGAIKGTVLVDGAVRAIWRTDRDAATKRSAVVVEHGPLGDEQRSDLHDEAARGAACWLDPQLSHSVRLDPRRA